MDDENLQKTFEAMMFTLSTYQKGFNTIYEENIDKEDMTMTDIIKITDVWWRGVIDMISKIGGRNNNE